MKARLRVVHVWGRTLVDERTFTRGVSVGREARCDFNVPVMIADATLFAPVRRGRTWQLALAPGMTGDLRVGGTRREVGELAAAGTTVHLAVGDWGVLRLGGGHELAFELSQREKKLPPPPLGDTGTSLPAAFLAFVLHALLVGAVFAVASWPSPGEGALAGYVVQIGRPRPRAPEPPPVDSKAPEAAAKPAATVENLGKNGGEGDKPRAHSPRARPDADPLAKVQSRGVLRYKESLAQIAAPSLADARLASAVAQVGDAGYGNGRGGGVGPEAGSGSSTRGGGGVGGGGGDPAEAVTRGPVDVGTGRGARGAPAVPKISEVKVNVAAENPDGDFGGLTPEQVRAVVEKHKGALQYCFEKELQKNPKLNGKVVVNWRIDASGLVTTAKIKSSTVGNPDVDDCLVRQVRKWQFPAAANGQVTDVRYPFVFSGH